MADTPRTNYDSLGGYSLGSEEITPTFSSEIRYVEIKYGFETLLIDNQ